MTARQPATTQAQPTAAEAAAHCRDMSELHRLVANQCRQAARLFRQYMARKACKK